MLKPVALFFLFGDAGFPKVETFAEKQERLDAEAVEQSMTDAGFVAQVLEGNAGGDTGETAYDDAKLEVTEYFSTETNAGAQSMSPRIFLVARIGIFAKFPALQAIHTQNSAITGATCRAESGFNSANDVLTKRKGTLGPALFKSLALGKLKSTQTTFLLQRAYGNGNYLRVASTRPICRSHNFENRKTLLHWSGV